MIRSYGCGHEMSGWFLRGEKIGPSGHTLLSFVGFGKGICSHAVMQREDEPWETLMEHPKPERFVPR